MKANSRSLGALIWYALWSPMFVISLVDLTAPLSHFRFSPAIFLIALAVTSLAFLQMVLFRPQFLSRRESALAITVIVLFGAIQFTNLIFRSQQSSANQGFDFGAYYVAADVLSHTPHGNIYHLELDPQGHMRFDASVPPSSHSLHPVPPSALFIYPPFIAVLMAPIAHLSFGTAYAFWTWLSIALLLASVPLAVSAAGIPCPLRLAIILGVGVCSFSPVEGGLFFGQIDCFILFLLSAAVWLLSRNRIPLAMLTLAFATLIKLTPVMVVPVLILHRRWKALAWYAASIVALVVLSAWRTGFAPYVQFWRKVLPCMSCGAAVSANTSLVAWVQELGLHYVPHWPNAPSVSPGLCSLSRAIAVLVFLVALWGFFLRRKQARVTRDVVLTILIAFVVSPITWWHHYTIVLLPLFYLWSLGRSMRVWLAFFFIVGSNFIPIALLIIPNPVIQFMLAAVTPGLILAILWIELSDSQTESGSSPRSLADLERSIPAA